MPVNLPTSSIVAPVNGGDSSISQLISGMSAAPNYGAIGAATGIGKRVPPFGSGSVFSNQNPINSGPVGNGIDFNPRFCTLAGGTVISGASVNLPVRTTKTVDYGVSPANTGFDANDPLVFLAATVALPTPVAGNVFHTASGAVLTRGYAGGPILVGDFIFGEIPT